MHVLNQRSVSVWEYMKMEGGETEGIFKLISTGKMTEEYKCDAYRVKS